MFSSDVYSYNSTTSSTPLYKLTQHAVDITKCFEAWPKFEGYTCKQRTGKCQTIAVFDIQHRDSQYLEAGLTDIQENEIKLTRFFSSPQPKKEGKKKDLWGIFNQHQVDFILKEGSLKAHILREGNFSSDERDYLLERGHPDRLCQLTEFFMNAIKYGQEVETETGVCIFDHTSGSSDFIACLHDRTWQSVATSTVYYTPEYSDVEQQEYYTTMISKAAEDFFDVTAPLVIRNSGEQFTRLIIKNKLADLPRLGNNQRENDL